MAGLKSICILYGLNEGPGMGQAFEAACRHAGFTLSHDPLTSDILLAHSGGCFLIPPDARASHIILVGLPYWPSRPWLIATALKVRLEFRSYRQKHMLRQWAHKWLYHVLYSFKLRSGLRMLRNQSFTRPWNSPHFQIIVRNREDMYCCPEVAQASFHGPRTFISLPGGHDNLWENPQPYIDLLQLEK